MTVEELVATLGLEVNKEGFEKAEKALDGLKGMALAVGAAVAAVGAAIAEMVHETAEAADTVDKASQAAGLSTDAYQELAHAAALSGLSAEELATGVQQLSRQAVSAAQDGGTMAETFRRAGIALKDSSGQVRPAVDLLGDLAERFHTMPDGTEKTAIAMELMGRAGARMIPLLNGGRASLAEMRKEAHQLGIVLDEDTIRAGLDFGDNMDRLAAGFRGLRYEIGGPFLRGAADLVGVLVRWVKEFNTLAKSPLKEVLTDIWSVIEGAVRIVWQPIRVIAEGLYDAIDSTVGWGNALAALGGIAAAYLWPIYGPILLTGAAIAALLLLFDDFITYLEGGDSAIGDLINTVQAMWPVVLALLQQKWDEFIAYLADKVLGIGVAISTSLQNAFQAAVGFVRGLIDELVGWIVEKAKGISSTVVDAVSGAALAAVHAVPGGDFLVSHLFGPGASSPQGSAQNTPATGTSGHTFSVSQQIISQHGESAADIGQASVDGFEEFHTRKMAEAAAAVG